MKLSDSAQLLLLLFVSFVVLSVGHATIIEDVERIVGSRGLLSLKESPHGTNATYECSPDGPCVACQYSEKNNEEYRCSETGYRIPLRCVEVKKGLKVVKKEKGAKKTRSCIPAGNEEKLSVFGFEVIVLCLLVISGSIVYYKKRQTTTMAGFSRIQSNARF